MRIITYLISLLVAAFLSACGGGGGSPGLPSVEKTPITSTAPAELVLAVGASSTSYALIGGVYPYKAVTSSNTQVATAVLSDRTFWIGGISSGTSTITITDSAGQILSIALTVENQGKFYTTAPAALTMTPGSTTRVFEIGGGQPGYTVFSDNLDVAVVDGSSGSVLKITPKKVGTANIVVSDSATPTKATVTIAVTVKSLVPLAVSPTSVKTFIGMPVDVYVTGGTPPYRVGGTIPAAVTVLPQVGSTDPSRFVVTASLLISSFDIVFVDSQNEAVIMTLESLNGTPQIRISPAAITVSEVDTQNIALVAFGSVGSVSAFSDNPKLLAASVDPTDPTKITVKTGSQGNRCVLETTTVNITIVDSNQSSAVAAVTINDNGDTPITVTTTDPDTGATTTTITGYLPCPP